MFGDIGMVMKGIMTVISSASVDLSTHCMSLKKPGPSRVARFAALSPVKTTPPPTQACPSASTPALRCCQNKVGRRRNPGLHRTGLVVANSTGRTYTAPTIARSRSRQKGLDDAGATASSARALVRLPLTTYRMPSEAQNKPRH